MNESIRTRELKMTVICVCENQFGAWRPRCPACGTPTPASKREESVVNPPRFVRAKQPKRAERRPDECIFCRRRKAKDTCPHCNERIHKNCQGLHSGDCAAFQVAREAALKAVNA